MKFCNAVVVSALMVASVASSQSATTHTIDDESFARSLKAEATTTKASAKTSKTWVNKLTPIANSDAFHMTPVRAIHARVQADAPEWDPTNKLFTSKYGATFEEKFRNALDTVNTASVEGALVRVQAEGINYNARSDATKCVRKDNVKYVVFYDIVFAQTNETLALYENEYGPFMAMNDGQCSSKSTACQAINGDKSQPQLGPFIGIEPTDADPRAPYPNAYSFSFPNSAVTLKYADKTEAARNATRRGLCAFNKLPDGISCTYNYRIAGWVPLDDVVGITKLHNKANTTTFKSFSEFCKDGGVEFKASTANGTWEESLPFWFKPQNASANARRATKLVNAYKAMLAARKSSQVESTLIVNTMVPLPTITELTAANPPCYLNVKQCGGQFGCKRALYSQQCVVCTEANAAGCVVKPAEFTYPTLVQAVRVTTSGAGNGSQDDILVVVGIAGGMVVIAIAALVAYRQRRRIREPRLKAELLSASTRASADSAAPFQLIEMKTRVEKLPSESSA